MNFELRIMNQSIFPTFSKIINSVVAFYKLNFLRFKEVIQTRTVRLLLAFLSALMMYLPIDARGQPMLLFIGLTETLDTIYLLRHDETYFFLGFLFVVFSLIWYVIWSVFVYSTNKLSVICALLFILWVILSFVIQATIPYNMIFLPILLFIFSFVHISFKLLSYFYKLIKHEEAAWIW